MATYPSTAAPYPARLAGHLERPSRWLWLLKWLLLVPHYVALLFLWLAFVVLSVGAFFVLLFGGSYPRGIFGFNVGVLRWTWRVAFYAFSANGTDRYPPFTLADVPDYPARLEIQYPETQRHGLPLLGWWLAGIPQYVVAGIFAGSTSWVTWNAREASWTFGWGGLIGLLVFVAVVVLLFRGEYPRGIFDFVLGLNRWVLRVGAYAALMTREYPPFRLDAGEDDPGGLTLGAAQAAPLSTAEARAGRWGAGRVLAVIAGTVVVLAGLVGVAAGGTALVFDQTQRNAAGYLMSSSRTYATDSYALVSDSYRTGTAHDWFVARDLLGTVRVSVYSTTPVFVGVARTGAVDPYLANVRREVATRFDARRGDFELRSGGAPARPPAAGTFWAAKATGTGVHTVSWKPEDGSWRIVLMNADGSAGVHAELAIGARFPHLLGIGIGVLAGGALLLALGGAVTALAVRR
jgi:hypothetical protein